MATVAAAPKNRLAAEIREHLLARLDGVTVCDVPFSHFYLENVFPGDIYADMMRYLPPATAYHPLSATKHRNTQGISTRDVLPLSGEGLQKLVGAQRELWSGVAAALASPEVKVAVFRKLATDLARRFGIQPAEVDRIQSFTKPSLFRDLEGYEIAPHPDGRAKIVTMQLYLPADRSQLDLGTAVYRRKITSPRALYSWHGRFEKVKQFLFQPNSGYAFAVSNSWGHKSWHGREATPAGSGVRNSILNLFFADATRTY